MPTFLFSLNLKNAITEKRTIMQITNERTLYDRAPETITTSLPVTKHFIVHGRPRQSKMSRIFAPNVLLIAMFPSPAQTGILK